MINKKLLQEMIDQKYVSVNKHPTENLFIYNYTQKAQFDRVWNEVTLQTRGLIMDDQFNVIARPFSKFFNLEEMTELPVEEFEVFEKYDGSLGILYWIGDTPQIATRGSFISDQALWATRWFRHNAKFSEYKRDRTYLFEIVAKWNRIVVQYEYEGLILLAINQTNTTAEYDIHDSFGVLSKRTTSNDTYKYCNTQEWKMEDVSKMQENKIKKRLPKVETRQKKKFDKVESREQNKGIRISQDSLYENTKIPERTKEEAMYRLWGSISTMRNGLRSQSKEEMEGSSENTNKRENAVRDSKMRSCMCKLSQDKNLFNKKIRICETLEQKDIKQLLKQDNYNREGFVIRYKSGVRVKIKLDEYVRLHRLVTGINTCRIWDLLRNNQPLDELLDRIPDEFYNWVQDVIKELNNQFDKHLRQAQEIFDQVKKLPTRKEQAIFVLKKHKLYSGIIFHMLDNKDYQGPIWDLIKPEAQKPFHDRLSA